MMQPSYPATADYDIDVTFRVFVTSNANLAQADPHADADVYVRDELLPQLRRVLRQLGADVTDIEYEIDDVRRE